MADKMNKDQELALEYNKDKNVLVSAGAGSGKTRVLTAKIVKLIKENGFKLEDLLVVTFSNAAAFEMKERVKKNLRKEKDPYLAELANKIDSSDITTFDAYYLKIVKTYGYLLGIRNDVSVIEEAVSQVKTNEFIEEVLNKYYESQPKVFKELIYYYAIKNDDSIKDIIRNIVNVASKNLDRKKYYKEYASIYFNKDSIKEYIKKAYNYFTNRILEARKYYLDINSDLYVNSMEETFYYPLQFDSYQKLFESVQSLEKFLTSRQYKISEEDKDNYDHTRKILFDVKADITKLGDEATILQNEERLQKYHQLLLDIAEEVSDKLWEYKTRFGAYTFKDIASLAYELVKIKEVNDILKNKIKYIMIDEYQDTNPLQEEFISLIANNNVFMVGDMKQAIYAFRDSDPTIFLDKYNRYQDDKDGQLIIFKDNYRSREEVLISINDIFSNIMSKEVGGVDYRFGHELRYGNTEAYSVNGKNTYNNAFELNLFEDNKENNNLQEINCVISDIVNKINSGYQVYDFDKRKLRPCKYSDFAILVEARSHYDTYKKAFNERQIPLASDEDTKIGVFQTTVVIKSILRLILAIKNNDTRRHINHPFMSIARSFICEYSDALIHNLVMHQKVPQDEIYLKAKNLIQYVDVISNEELLRIIIKEFDIVNKLEKIGDVLANEANIQKMISFAKDMDKLEYSFEEMTIFFDHLEKDDIDLSIENSDEVSDAVKMMTIHKSKGLEFPICYYIYLGRSFKSSGSGTVTNKFGVHLKDIFSNNSSLFSYLSEKYEKSVSRDEELRLLYVAITRAKEKPIAFYNKDKFEKIISSKINPVSDAKKMLDFIVASDFKKYVHDFTPNKDHINNVEQEKNKKVKIEIRNVNVPSEYIYPKKASKDLSLSVDKSLLRYGTKIHELLEIVDFKTKDTKFIKNKKEKEAVERIINSKIFKGVESALIYHEYEFEDEKNNTVGVIDLLVIYNDHIDIVDFKLKNLDDEQYVSQLEIYENYVRDNLNNYLPINKYLLSVLTGEEKKL